jgi:hypothetical protein
MPQGGGGACLRERCDAASLSDVPLFGDADGRLLASPFEPVGALFQLARKRMFGSDRYAIMFCASGASSRVVMRWRLLRRRALLPKLGRQWSFVLS